MSHAYPIPFPVQLVLDEVGEVHMRGAALPAAPLRWHEHILPAARCLLRILPADAAWSMANTWSAPLMVTTCYGSKRMALLTWNHLSGSLHAPGKPLRHEQQQSLQSCDNVLC